MNRLVKISGILFISILMLLPMYQHLSQHFSKNDRYKSWELKGMYAKREKPSLSSQNWFQQSYQNDLEAYLKQNTGFQDVLVRIRNEWAFRAFKAAKANNVLVGKQDYLYAQGYIDAVTGKDFIGEDSIQGIVHKLQLLQSWLHLKGKELIFVQAPGKGTFYPEHIPDRFFHKEYPLTNYETFREAFLQSSVPYLDVNNWFLKMKDTTQHILYPKTGIHWSNYAEHLVFDSLARIIDNRLGCNLSNLESLNTVKQKEPNSTDTDIEDGMNLLVPIAKPLFSYPKPVYKDGEHIRVNVIGDSFFWGPMANGIAQRYFDPIGWWYYFDEFRFNARMGELRKLEEVDVLQELLEADLLVIIATDAQLYRMPWGLLQHLDEIDFWDSLEQE